MADNQYYILKENYSCDNKDGKSIEIPLGSQFMLLEELQNDNIRLKCIKIYETDMTEIILPRSILENMSKSSTYQPALILRSQSTVKERICSLNLLDKNSEGDEKFRLSSFGHGPEVMTRSLFEKNRSRTLPISTVSKERCELEPITTEKEKINSTTDILDSQQNYKWQKIEENDREIYINVDNGERWLSTIDDFGRQYFYNEFTRQSSWNLPDNKVELEPSFEDEAVRPLDEVLQSVIESSNSDVSWHENSSESENKEQNIPSINLDTINSPDQEDDGSRFNIRHLKKEHISGPLNNKIMRTERIGIVEKIKSRENGKEVSNKWATFHVILTGPELLFYKDVKAAIQKPGLPQGKFDLKLKIQNLQFSDMPISNSMGNVIQVEDTGAPGSNITYLLRFPSIEELKAWKIALQLAKNWQNENLYSGNVFKIDSGNCDDVIGDRHNIGLKLKHFLKRRPTRESLEVLGILKLESVFGSTLDILCEQEKSKVPEFVYRCILAIESRGLHHNGLYRISGNQAKIQKLRLAVDENRYQLNSESMELETLTGALKSFFKELKEPLFDDEFCSKMVEILSHHKTDRKNQYRDINYNSVKKLLLKLKPCHYETAKVLLGHLYKVAALSSKNLMDVSNLSMVWGPNLYMVTGAVSTKLAVILMTYNTIVDFLINCYLELFEKT